MLLRLLLCTWLACSAAVQQLSAPSADAAEEAPQRLPLFPRANLDRAPQLLNTTYAYAELAPLLLAGHAELGLSSIFRTDAARANTADEMSYQAILHKCTLSSDCPPVANSVTLLRQTLALLAAPPLALEWIAVIETAMADNTSKMPSFGLAVGQTRAELFLRFDGTASERVPPLPHAVASREPRVLPALKVPMAGDSVALTWTIVTAPPRAKSCSFTRTPTPHSRCAACSRSGMPTRRLRRHSEVRALARTLHHNNTSSPESTDAPEAPLVFRTIKYDSNGFDVGFNREAGREIGVVPMRGSLLDWKQVVGERMHSTMVGWADATETALGPSQETEFLYTHALILPVDKDDHRGGARCHVQSRIAAQGRRQLSSGTPTSAGAQR